MVKRRTLTAPSTEDLAKLEDEFRRETSRPPLAAPISHVAAEAAAAHDPRPAEDRTAAARDRASAARLEQAEARGLLILELPMEEIEPDAMVRDRMDLDPDDMRELQLSIAAHGLRLPVEVFALPEGQGPRYGLLSGYRRYRAVQYLRGLSGQAKYDTIRAIVRDPQALGGAVAAMVEENEIRSNLSLFERGRIAVIAARNDAFANVEAAVDALFPQASKSKRSKIRSFALVFEELGDMLAFPHTLREKDGLRLAAALREGAESRLRDRLAEKVAESAAEELAILEAALAGLDPAPARPERGGRPPVDTSRARSSMLPTGIRLVSGHDGKHWFIRLEGKRVDGILVEDMMRELERLLGPA